MTLPGAIWLVLLTALVAACTADFAPTPASTSARALERATGTPTQTAAATLAPLPPTPSAAAATAPIRATATVSRTPPAATAAARTPTPRVSRVTPSPTFGAFPGLAEGTPHSAAQDACGSYSVVRRVVAATGGEQVTLLDGNGRLVRDWKPAAPGESYSVAWCYDLNGDGAPELMIEAFSGGAHCCLSYTLLSLGKTAATWITYDGGNGGDLTPQELDGQPPFELVGRDDRLAYYGDVPYALSSFFPIVFAWRNGRYTQATRDFPTLLQQDRLAALHTAGECGGEKACLRGLGLHLLADSLLIGDWDGFKTALPFPASVTAWLDQQRTEVQRRLLK